MLDARRRYDLAPARPRRARAAAPRARAGVAGLDARPGDRACARPNESSSRRADDRVAGHARTGAHRVATSDTTLPARLCSIELALAGDHRAGRAHPRVELDRVEHERGARARARLRTRPTARRTARPRRRSSARRAGRARAAGPSSCSRLVSRATASSSAPFCGPNTRAASSNGVRTSHSTTILRAAEAAGLADRADRARAAVGRGAAADAEVDDLGAGLDGGDDQLTGAERARGERRRARPARPGRGRWPPPSRRSDRAPAPRRAPNDASIGRPSGSLTVGRAKLAAERGQQRVERPLAAVGDRAQVDRTAGAAAARADRGRDLGGADSVPLNESGATRTVVGDAGDDGTAAVCRGSVRHPIGMGDARDHADIRALQALLDRSYDGAGTAPAQDHHPRAPRERRSARASS